MIKKIIIIIISILVFLGVSLFGLYYFRNPLWVSKYEDPTFEYLDKYLYHYDGDNTLRGVLWMNFISYGDNYLHLQPTNSEDQRVRLPLLSNEFINIDIGSLNASKYPIYLSLSFESKDKNILDEMLCSYIKGDFCIKELELESWRIYENTFPYPELSKAESMDLYFETLSFFYDNKIMSDIFSEDETLSEYIISEKLDKEKYPFEGNKLLLPNDDIERFQYVFKVYSLVDKDYLYLDTLQFYLCDDNSYEIAPMIFKDYDVEYIESLCGVDLGPSSVLDSENSIEEDLLREIRDNKETNYDEENSFKYLKNGYFNGKNNPECNENTCSRYILNLYKILLYTIQENEESL